MTRQEVETLYPLDHLFTLLDDFVTSRPLDEDCTLTKQDIHNLILHTKTIALSYPIPRYDIFTYLALEIRTNMIDGNFCQHQPQLCGWGIKYRTEIAPLYDFKAMK